MDDMNKYRDLFFEETDEYLQTLDDCILELEKSPDDNALLNEIFRAAHTLKGMAATMGYDTMAKLTHKMENVFDLFKKDEVEVTTDIISLLFNCLDKLSEIVEGLRQGEDDKKDISDLVDSLDSVVNDGEEFLLEEENKFELRDLSETDIKIIDEAKSRNYNGFNIVITIDDECSLKGARAYLVISKLEQHGDVLSTNPSPEDLEEGHYGKNFQVFYITKSSLEETKKIVEQTAEIESVFIEDTAQTCERMEKEKAESKKEEKKEKEEEKKKEEDNGKSTTTRRPASRLNQSIRVDLDRLDSIMNLVSELVIYRTRLEDISNQYQTSEINEPLGQVAKITSELQDLVLKIRMQPVEVVMNRFPRMIRDLSQELNKDIELVIEGEDTELDRTVVSELSEPLVHLIRNAADHGIEPLERRLELGKNKTGLVKVSSYQEGNRVVIIVSDDGKGLIPEVLKKSAEKKGIDTKGLNDRELINLIFHPGFSTAESVTGVSGRGVGMDVVRSKISSLGGDITVYSEIDVGTQFIIKLPLTLSIIQALMVTVSDEIFAIPLSIIERIVRLDEKDIQNAHDTEIFIERDRAIPIIRVSEKLGLKEDTNENHVILISLGDKDYGLLVNDLIGEQEIVIKKLGKSLSNMKEYLGATILGNGDIVLILDIGNLVNRIKGERYE